MNDGSIFFNLLAITFANILYNTLHKPIGQNLVIVWGLLTIDINAMLVSLSLVFHDVDLKTSIIVLHNTCPTISQ